MRTYYKNPRQITSKQFDELGEWLEELGDLSGVVHDLNSDQIIAGNQRGRVFDINGCEIVLTECNDVADDQGTVGLGYVIWRGHRYTYRQVRWDEGTAEKANVIANKAGGSWDWDVLANEFEVEDLLGWGFSEIELEMNALAGEGEADGSGADEGGEWEGEVDVDLADELRKKWGVVRGQIWEIGAHRVMCGDARSVEDIEALMGGQLASLLATDPPYNVGFDYGEAVDDTRSWEEYRAFVSEWFEPWCLVSERQVITPGGNNLWVWMQSYRPYHVAPWTKTNAMTNGKVSRFWCWEPVLFYGEGWARQRHDEIFNFPVPPQKAEGLGSLTPYHPCPKPLAMWVDIVENYSETGDIVADAFLGSGTTVVACQQTGRTCYGMDVEPKYVSVTLERLAGLGLEPRMVAQSVLVT